MPHYEPWEFVKKLNADELTTPTNIRLLGLIKPSENNADALLFSNKPTCETWLELPASLIESIDHIRNISCGDHQHPYVAVTLKAPSDTNADAVAFSKLYVAARSDNHLRSKRFTPPTALAPHTICEILEFDGELYMCCMTNGKGECGGLV